MLSKKGKKNRNFKWAKMLKRHFKNVLYKDFYGKVKGRYL